MFSLPRRNHHFGPELTEHLSHAFAQTSSTTGNEHHATFVTTRRQHGRVTGWKVARLWQLAHIGLRAVGLELKPRIIEY